MATNNKTLNDFLKDTEVNNFLKIGLTPDEISILFKTKIGIQLSNPLSRGLKRNLRSIDPNTIAKQLAGRDFGLKKGKGPYKRRGRREGISGKKYIERKYIRGRVYYKPFCAKLARVFFEIRDNGKTPSAIKILDTLHEDKEATLKQLIQRLGHGYDYHNRLSGLRVAEAIIESMNGEYRLTSASEYVYTKEIQEIWDLEKNLKFRACFY